MNGRGNDRKQRSQGDGRYDLGRRGAASGAVGGRAQGPDPLEDGRVIVGEQHLQGMRREGGEVIQTESLQGGDHAVWAAGSLGGVMIGLELMVATDGAFGDGNQHGQRAVQEAEEEQAPVGGYHADAEGVEEPSVADEQ